MEAPGKPQRKLLTQARGNILFMTAESLSHLVLQCLSSVALTGQTKVKSSVCTQIVVKTPVYVDHWYAEPLHYRLYLFLFDRVTENQK